MECGLNASYEACIILCDLVACMAIIMLFLEVTETVINIIAGGLHNVT